MWHIWTTNRSRYVPSVVTALEIIIIIIIHIFQHTGQRSRLPSSTKNAWHPMTSACPSLMALSVLPHLTYSVTQGINNGILYCVILTDTKTWDEKRKTRPFSFFFLLNAPSLHSSSRLMRRLSWTPLADSSSQCSRAWHHRDMSRVEVQTHLLLTCWERVSADMTRPGAVWNEFWLSCDEKWRSSFRSNSCLVGEAHFICDSSRLYYFSETDIWCLLRFK